MTDKQHKTKLIYLWVVITPVMEKRGYDYLEPKFVKPRYVTDRDRCRCYKVRIPTRYIGKWRLWDSEHKTIPSKEGYYIPTSRTGAAYVLSWIDWGEHYLYLTTITDVDNQTCYETYRYKLERVVDQID